MSHIKVLMISLLLTGVVQAQFAKSLEISSFYDDNLFRSPQQETDMLTDITLGLSYQLPKSDLGFSYTGDFFLYRDNTDRNFSMHEIGIDYSTSFGAADAHTLYLGSNYNLRVNGENYDYYDYSQFYAYANARFDLGWLFLTSGYNYRERSYSNLAELSNSQHYLFAQINKSFATRTTLIVETDIGFKSFAGERTYTFSTRNDSSMGHMRGRNTSSRVLQSAESMPVLSHAVLLARVSQSLHDKLGLYLQYRRQINLKNQTNFANASAYYQDEELFDDPFSYESEGYSSQLTWILPWTMKMQLGGAIVEKEYISEQAFVSALDTVGAGGMRQDEKGRLYINISKTFFLNSPWVESFLFNIHYNYIRSESNSYWYDYRNNIIGGSIQWNF